MDKIAVLIRCLNEEAFIGQTLESVFSQETRIPFEVTVIDSGSTDRTLEIVKKYKVRLIEIPAAFFSYGHALNRGLSECPEPVLCNLSAHCLPRDPSWLEKLTAPILRGDSHAVYGRQIPLTGMNRWEEILTDSLFPASPDIRGRVPFSNANCAFLREMWERTAFDEELPRWEDYLWYLLLKNRYRFSYAPEAAVHHSHLFSIEALEAMSFKDGKAAALIKKKYGIDILDAKGTSATAKLATFLDDIVRTAGLFSKKRYWKELMQLPVVKFRGYAAYWRGYASADRPPVCEELSKKKVSQKDKARELQRFQRG